VDEQPKRPVTAHAGDPKKPALRAGRRAVAGPVE
jgi:hypothetical protein